MRNFYGANKRRSYFEGWYFKQQNASETIAFIPAFHVDKDGKASASVQIITNAETYHARFPYGVFEADTGCLRIKIGSSVFSERGCKLNILTDDFSLKGMLCYGPFASIRNDIMGPFRFAPFLQCRHSVFSMYHTVNGSIVLNGRQIAFKNAAGYAEGDRGISFPKRYIWTQCLHGGVSIMISIADIPFYGFRFTGCIGYIYMNGTECRVATYLNAKIKHISNDGFVIEQGKLTIRAQLMDASFQYLRAPESGDMLRLIHESASCRVKYSVTVDRRVLADFTDERAGFESNWNGE